MQDSPEAPRLSQVIAGNVRAMRNEKGWSQDELAKRLREAGESSWTRPMVAALEAGRKAGAGKAIDPETLVLLALVFECSVADLMKSKSKVSVGNNRHITPKGLAQLFAGTTAKELSPRQAPHSDEGLRKFTTMYDTFKDALESYEAEVPKRGEIELSELNELERAIARRLATTPSLVTMASYHLFKRSATEERDVRARERPNAKKWVSREVRQEIENLLAAVGELEGKEKA